MTEMVEIEVIVKKFSPYSDAVFVEHPNNNFHLPHSQIKDFDEVEMELASQSEDPIILEIPRWLAAKENLI